MVLRVMPPVQVSCPVIRRMVSNDFAMIATFYLFLSAPQLKITKSTSTHTRLRMLFHMNTATRGTGI
jgi:hypothetical protein